MNHYWTLSSANPDRMNDVVNQTGIDTSNYRKNPVVLWAHDSSSPPIGKTTKIGIVNGKLQATMQFSKSAMASGIEQHVCDGSLRACSIGFSPIDWTPSNRPGGGITFNKVELLEWSICPVPANPDALLIPGGEGKAKARLRTQRLLDRELIKVRDEAKRKADKVARLAELARVKAGR
jgi:HK97 family phage prohead protease